MSRQIPMDKPLNDEDRRYLRQLGANGSNLEARLDQEFPPDPDALNDFNMKERKALAEMNGVGLNVDDQDALLAENEKLRKQLADALAGRKPEADGDSDPEVVPVNYTGWKKAELEAEVDRVNAEDPDAKLPKGTVEEMKVSLTEYFTA